MIHFNQPIQQVNVFNLAGPMVTSKVGMIQKIDISNQPNGTYVLQIIDEKGIQKSIKIVKK